MYGYAAVIFRDPLYAPNMASLAKLVCFSSAVHQVFFCLFSTLPFAIGQVQDAGLIFLSHIASNVAASAAKNAERRDAAALSAAGGALGVVGDGSFGGTTNAARSGAGAAANDLDDVSMLLSTAIVFLGLSTALLGVCLVVVGRARLAKYAKPMDEATHNDDDPPAMRWRVMS